MNILHHLFSEFFKKEKFSTILLLIISILINIFQINIIRPRFVDNLKFFKCGTFVSASVWMATQTSTRHQKSICNEV